MFKHIATACVALVGLGLPLAGSVGQTAPGEQPKAGEAVVTSVIQQDFKFITWEGTRGTNIFQPERGEGAQFYAPLTAAMTANLANAAIWELAAKTGYVWSHHGTNGQEATYEGSTDTVLAAKVTIGGLTYISPFVSVSANVPTGESFLPGQRRLARMDPDLVELGAYGEGFNVNPAIGFTFAPTANFTLSPSIGYAWRGKFGREGGVATTNNNLNDTKIEADPGDVLQASLTAAAKIGAATLQGSFTYVSQSEVTMDGVPVGQAGAGYAASVRVLYPISPKLAVDLTGGWSFNERNKVPKTPPSSTLPFGGGDLIEEAKNSNSHVLIGAIQPTYALTDHLALGVNYSFLWRDENYYNIIEDRFVPARVKHSLGVVLDYAVNKSTVISLSGSRFWVHDEAGPVGSQALLPGQAPEPLPERDYTGWTGALTARVQF
jgi:hypothetical protein